MSGAMVPQLRFPGFVDEWDEIAFDEALVSLPTKKHQVFTTEFQKAGTFPVIDQGADFIAGFSDDASKVYSDVPIIAFGDHTTILKYVDFPFVVGADGVKLIKPKAWNAQFAYYALSAYPVEQEGYKRHFSTLRERDISAPSIPEQQKIADFLGTVDAKLDALRQKKSGLEAFKSGLMKRLFSQELRFTRDDGTEFPEWDQVSFAEIAERSSDKLDPRNVHEGMPVIDLENIESGTGRIIHAGLSDESASLKSVFRTGEVLFGKLRPYLRKFAQPAFEGCCSSEIWVLRGKRVSNDFLFHLIQNSRFMELAAISSGSKMPRADWSIISSAEFDVPHPDEQRKIADALSAMDAKIAAVANQITHMETFKKGLLQQMFV